MANGTQRAEFILQQLLQQGRVDAEQLSQQLQVNSSTIRRDLERLEKQNLLRRVHGGAIALDMLTYGAYGAHLTFQENMGKRVEEKTRIAQTALGLIEPGDAIALSPGTTTTLLARAIRHAHLHPLTVVTNAINIAMELHGLEGITLTLTGGLLLSDFFALVGPLAEQSLNEMFVDKAFLGVTGLSLEYGLTGPNQLETLTHRLTLKHSRQGIILADSTKLGHVALHAIAPLTAIHTLVTDAHASASFLASLHEQGIEVCQG